jgi:hypothetical protein
MKSLKDYKESLITELFDRPVKWHKEPSVCDDYTEYRFTITPNDYFVSFDKEDNRVVVSFSIETPNGEVLTDKTNTGHELPVFSTVLDIIRSYLKDHSSEIESLEFSAEKTDSKNNRGSLYSRMVKKYIPKDWKVDIHNSIQQFYFTLYKKR